MQKFWNTFFFEITIRNILLLSRHGILFQINIYVNIVIFLNYEQVKDKYLYYLNFIVVFF